MKRSRPRSAAGRKRLWLHIGHYKTGTTALQVFCARNRSVLLRHGLDYCGVECGLSKHSALAFSLLRAAGVDTLMHGYDRADPPDRIWAGLLDAVRASDAPACLISSEEFMRLGAHPQAADRLERIVAGAPDIEFRVIAWLRDPQSHLRSWYNQLVKMGATVPGFNATVARVMEPVHYDYGAALAPWIRIFGPGAITLRPYDPAWREGDGLYRDALAVLGLGWPRGLEQPDRDPNPRIDDSRLELVRMMQNAGFPSYTVEWAQTRADRVRAREAELERGATQDFGMVRARARDGLARLSDLPGCALEPDAFALPEPEGAETQALLDSLGLVLSELNFLRTKALENDAALTRRIEALEARLDRPAQTGGGSGGA